MSREEEQPPLDPDVREALLALGLTPQEASGAVNGLEVDDRPVDELLKEALQRVGR